MSGGWGREILEELIEQTDILDGGLTITTVPGANDNLIEARRMSLT